MESKDQVVINVDARKSDMNDSPQTKSAPSNTQEDKSEMNASNPQAESAPSSTQEDKSEMNASNPQESAPSSTQGSDAVKKLVNSIDEKLLMLDERCDILVCFYKVPKKHRNRNQDAYNPRIVSIGPLHHGESQVQTMEVYKLKYLKNFLDTFQVPMKRLADFANQVEMIVRSCYEDIYIRDQGIFSQVILLDGVFVVELFLKNYFPKMREEGDMIFDNSWVRNDVLHDLLLLENQLPMMVLTYLYNVFVSHNDSWYDGANRSYVPSFEELACNYFKEVCNTGKLQLDPVEEIEHLVEFLAILHKPSSDSEKVGEPKPEFARCSTATELQAAGVKFRKGSENCIFDVRFENGELIIPQLVINDFTETFFRNSIAFEQAGRRPKNITSYVILLDNLIDTQKDVELLIKHKIIHNQLGSPEQVADVINNLYKEFVADPDDFYFSKLCSELNVYSRDRCHKLNSKFTKWSAMLRRDYFGSPWSVISFVTAVVLLVLTVIQTVCSLLPFLR